MPRLRCPGRHFIVMRNSYSDDISLSICTTTSRYSSIQVNITVSPLAYVAVLRVPWLIQDRFYSYLQAITSPFPCGVECFLSQAALLVVHMLNPQRAPPRCIEGVLTCKSISSFLGLTLPEHSLDSVKYTREAK